jgi:hypothetical protein
MFQDFQAAIFAYFVSWIVSADFCGILQFYSADAHKKRLAAIVLISHNLQNKIFPSVLKYFSPNS